MVDNLLDEKEILENLGEKMDQVQIDQLNFVMINEVTMLQDLSIKIKIN